MKLFPMLIGALCAAVIAGPALAGEKASKPEAEAMVKKAVAFLKANGAQKAFSEFDSKQGEFHDRDLYITVYDMSGKCLAHGANAKLIGKDLSDSQDIDGKYFVKERTELAKTKQSFWQDYKFANPVTKKIEPKEMYCETVDGVAVCGGVYKS